MNLHPIKIYQAPLQGFTDFTFRSAFAEVFGGIDKFFIPYLSYGKGREIKKSQMREVFPENNSARPVVPQVLFSDEKELVDLVRIVTDLGYTEVNLNLGCPYPMATNKGRGAAWLEKPADLRKILQQLFDQGLPAKYSAKMRAGMTSDQDFKAIVDILNQFSLEEIIFHPRTASQMYTGKANPELFAEAQKLTRHPMVYNGDLFSENDFQKFRLFLPGQSSWMVGRGLLMDPSLPGRMKGTVLSKEELVQKLTSFHDKILNEQARNLQGDGHLLQKMEQFWIYFSHMFLNDHKARKLIKKSRNRDQYLRAVNEIFRNLI